MNRDAWTGADRVLFILDASHRVEESLLRQWVARSRDKNGYTGTIGEVVVPVARSPEAIPTRALASALDIPPETLLAPLRVGWRTSQDDEPALPRARDLVWGDPRRPGLLRAWQRLRRHPEHVRIIVGEAATLGDMQRDCAERHGETPGRAELAEFVAGRAGLALDIAERRFRGSRYKVPRRVSRSLESSPGFRTALRQLSSETGRSLSDLRAEAAKIMKELIAIPRIFWLDVTALLNRRILALGYGDNVVLDQPGIERARRLCREHPSALLWSHKTYIDGLASQYIFFAHDFPAIHTLGGVNMAFAGVGFLGRRAGAIFIRRSFQDDPLYKVILRQYIGYLLEKRFPFSWSFEGTRSRVGKLMPPRYGLIKYVTEAAHFTGARNLHFFPIAISYDLIGDVPDMTTEQVGAVKRPETLGWFIRYLGGLRRPLGRIYFDFGEPVVLDESPHPDDKLALQKIAFQVGWETNRVTPITLVSLSTMILLGAAPWAMTREELLTEIDRLAQWARERDIRMTSDFDPDKREQRDKLTEHLVANGLITRYDGGPDIVYTIDAAQHANANYYRNTTVHHFVNKAIAELSLLRAAAVDDNAEAEFWKEAERLRDLFKFEFFYSPTDRFRGQVREELCRYDTDWADKLREAPAAAQQLLANFQPLVAHGVLLLFTEAYRVVADVMARADNAAVGERECIQQSLAYGRQAYLQRRISSEASIGKLLFQNGWRLMDNMKLTGGSEGGDTDLGERRRKLAADLRELAHRIDIVRTMALPR